MADTTKKSKNDEIDEATRTSLENAITNSNPDARQVSEEEIVAQYPPPVEPETS